MLMTKIYQKKKEIIFFNKADLLNIESIKRKIKSFQSYLKTSYEIVSLHSKKDIVKIKKVLIKNVKK